MNNATFAGRLGRDAEVRHTQSGQSVTGFAIAVDEYAGKGERRTLWVDCSMWGERGEKLAQHLTKGSAVAVSGQVGIQTFDGRNGPQSKLTLRVSDVTLLGGKQEWRAPARDSFETPTGAGARTQSGTGPVEHTSDGFDDDFDSIPF